METLTKLATDIVKFINDVLVPLIFAVAFIVFIFGVFRYFIAGADNEEKRKKGKDLIVYGLVGFFVMISVWGLVNLLVGTFGFDSTSRPCLPTFSGDCTSGSTDSNVPNNFVPSGGGGGVTCVLSSGTEVVVTRGDCTAYGGTVK